MEEKSVCMPREPALRDPQLPREEPWKFFCLAMILFLFLLVVILGVDLIRVLLFLYHMRDELKQLDTKFSQGLADGGHKRDSMRGEMFRQLEALQAGNGSPCEPCPEDWLAFEGSCYSFSIDVKMWSEARNHCAEEGAHLVIINSQAEQNFLVISKDDGAYWIGLRRQYPKDIYTWEDGSVPTFTNWNAEVSDLCDMAHMKKSGHWSSSYGIEYYHLKWICEKPQIC